MSKRDKKSKAAATLRQPVVQQPIVNISSAIVLGKRYRDSITGSMGVATQWQLHVNGCRQVVLDPGADDDGKLRDRYAFDEGRLELLDEYGDVVEPVRSLATAGIDDTTIVEAR